MNYIQDLTQTKALSTSSQSLGKTDEESTTEILLNHRTFLTRKTKKYKNLVDCYKCQVDDCEMLFETEDELLLHKEKHDTLFLCPFLNCNLQFQHQDNLFKHQKTHLPCKKMYQCSFPGCMKKFTASYNLKIHYRCHTNEKPYKCEICGAAYYDRANYKYHTRTGHLTVDDRDVTCSHCMGGHVFKTKKQKIMHHDKLQDECRTEKNYLINLISELKNSIDTLIEKSNKKKEIEESSPFAEVKKQSKVTEGKIFDYEQYEALFLKKEICKFKQ